MSTGTWPDPFTGQRVVVAGGTSGIGLAAARVFAAHGATVTVTGRDPQRAAAAAVPATDADDDGGGGGSGSVRGVVADATDPAALEAVFTGLGPLDHLVVALSGGSGAGPFRDLALRDVQSGFAGKVWPQLNTVQAALPHLRPDGSVTLVTAISTRSAQPGTAGLAAVNGALEAMVPTLAVELAPLRVNAVAPGVIRTGWWNFLPEQERVDTFTSYAAVTPAGRVGEPADVADAIVFLAGNSFVTGVVLPCDGGLRLPRR